MSLQYRINIDTAVLVAQYESRSIAIQRGNTCTFAQKKVEVLLLSVAILVLLHKSSQSIAIHRGIIYTIAKKKVLTLPSSAAIFILSLQKKVEVLPLSVVIEHHGVLVFSRYGSLSTYAICNMYSEAYLHMRYAICIR